MRIKSLVPVALSVLLLAGCAGGSEETAASDADTLLAPYGLDGLDGIELVDAMDRIALDERPADLIASVRYDEVLVSGVDSEEPIPVEIADEFYLSVAPFVDGTHDCHFHSLTTCVGELQNEEIHLTITDTDTGEVLFDETATTFDNGFFGVWIPRDIEADVFVEYDGKTAETTITTADEDATCITTMQVA